MNEDTDQKSYFIPYEVVTIILGHMLRYKSLIQCRLVCRAWNQIIVEESWKFVVKLKENEEKPYSNAEIEKISEMPWYVLHAMCVTDGIFDRNLVMTKHRSGRPFWNLANPNSPCWQTVSTDVENESKCNDELSNTEDFFTCKIQVGKLQNRTKTVQIIKLPNYGLSSLILRKLRPKIHVSFWVRLEAGLEAPVDRDQRPRYNVIVNLRSYNLDLINQNTHPDRSNLLLNAVKGKWKKVTLADQDASEFKPSLDSILIEHLLYNTAAKCEVTRILIRIRKPNFLNFDWNIILKDVATNYDFESVLIPDRFAWLKNATYSAPTFLSSKDLLRPFDTHVEVLAFPASGVFIPEIWYGRPLADVIKVKDDDVDAPTCYENANHLLLYDLRYTVHLREHGLFGFIMDELQPTIKACINNNVIHRDEMKYEMTLSLLDSEGKTLHRQKAVEVLSKLKWTELTLKFQDYGPGVAYIVINVQRHMCMNRCTQAVHGPSTFTFLNHIKSVVNATKLDVSYARTPM